MCWCLYKLSVKKGNARAQATEPALKKEKLKKEVYYRKVVKIGGGRYLAIGSFAPVWWDNVKATTAIYPYKIIIVLECANGRTPVSNSSK